MKLNTLIIGLLIGFLVACDRIQTNSKVQSTPQPQKINQLPETKTSQPTNPFDSVSLPQASCGDKLPKNAKADNFKFYPVFVNYDSKVNLEIVKSKFCGDAIQKYRIDKGHESIQVTSFTSEERANQFKQFLASKLGSAEVGKPTVRAAKPKPQPTKNAVAKAAQLNTTASGTVEKYYIQRHFG